MERLIHGVKSRRCPCESTDAEGWCRRHGQGPLGTGNHRQPSWDAQRPAPSSLMPSMQGRAHSTATDTPPIFPEDFAWSMHRYQVSIVREADPQSSSHCQLPTAQPSVLLRAKASFVGPCTLLPIPDGPGPSVDSRLCNPCFPPPHYT